jgi:hypothetical protein
MLQILYFSLFTMQRYNRFFEVLFHKKHQYFHNMPKSFALCIKYIHLYLEIQVKISIFANCNLCRKNKSIVWNKTAL